MEKIELELNQHGDGAFYLFDDGKVVAKMLVGKNENDLYAYHTEAMTEGKGYAKKLFDALVSYAREHSLKITAYCPYVHTQFRRRAEQYADVWKKEKEK